MLQLSGRRSKITIPPDTTAVGERYTAARAKSREAAELVAGAEIAIAIERHGAAGLPDHLAAKAARFLAGRVLGAGELEGELKRATVARSAAAAEELGARQQWDIARSRIAAAYRPAHDEITRKMAKAVAALAAAIVEEQQLLVEAEAAGADRVAILPRAMSLGVGSPTSWASPISAWLRQHAAAN